MCHLRYPFWLVILLLGAAQPLRAAETVRQDTRSATVQSTLKDLSTTNDAAIAGKGLKAVPGKDALGEPRTDLVVPPPPDTATRMQDEVQSSLHKLRRETVISQTPDPRKAQVDNDRDRQADAAAADIRTANDDG